jgi:DeoR/GlpR family transcriptional regulator of sugar metabolism
MALRADKRIILTDSSKFNKRGVVQLMPGSQVTHVITNAIPENCRAALAQSGVEIVIA